MPKTAPHSPAPPLTDRDQILIAQLLLAKHQHQVIVPGPADHRKISIIVDRP